MEANLKLLKVDQLYHILKTNTFTFCLICLEDINSASDDVGQHLASTNHTESIKRLLKACNPSLLDEIENERFVDIVLKSVFDISVLLGKETCYVSKKDGFWFCLMCEKSIIESNGTDAIIKTDITNHILSDIHVQNVKKVSFLYKYNANQDFLRLLNKSIIYCSVCKDVLQCKEIDLLKTAIVHLEMKHPIHAMTNGFQFEESIVVENKESKTTEEGFVDERMPGDLKIQNISSTESAGEFKDEHFDELVINTESSVEIVKDVSLHINAPKQEDGKQSSKREWYLKETNICMCLCCKKRVKLIRGQSYIFSLSDHFQRAHRIMFIEISLRGLISFVTFHNDPGKVKLMNEVRKINQDLLKLIKTNCDINGHLKYILKTTTDYVCLLCMDSMSPCLDDNLVLLERFQDHFNCSNHHQCEEEHIQLREAFKIDINSQTIKTLIAQKSKLKMKIVKKKEQKKERQANKMKPKKLNKCKFGSIKLEVKPKSIQQVKTDIQVKREIQQVKTEIY